MWRIIRCFKFIATVGFFWSCSVNASSDIGARVSVEGFTIKISFSAMDESSQLNYFRRSSDFLFDLLVTMQQNELFLMNDAGSYWFELSDGGNVISIYKMAEDGTFELVDNVENKDDPQDGFISKYLCLYAGLTGCSEPISHEKLVTLYLLEKSCKTREGSDGIWFGAFPSDNSKTPYVLTQTRDVTVQPRPPVVFDRDTFLRTFDFIE